MWWFLAGETVIFGGAIVSFVLIRTAHPAWAADAARTLDAVGAVNTFVLLTSSLFVVLAHRAAEEGHGGRAARHLSAAAALGIAFLGFKAFEYAHELGEGLTPLTNLFWSFYFFLTGLHALHVTAGILALGLVAAVARKGRNLRRVEYVGLYWHLVDVVWIFLFPLLYLAN